MISPLPRLALAALTLGAARPPEPVAVTVTLSEWTVTASNAAVPAGPVAFTIINDGTIPHALELEGPGLERETPLIPPGRTVTLSLTLPAGRYHLYCPVGIDSHRKLGMDTELRATAAPTPPLSGSGASTSAVGRGTRVIHVTGGGPVIQLLPGPFPFADSAGPILQEFGPEQEGLEAQMQNGPYSNNVAPIGGTFAFTAWDLGATRDSVDGVAEVTTRDGARWRLLLDRVQTTDVPHHPKFGGVILGLYYHGNTRVHTPLVPTINSAVALWAIGHLYRNGALVTDHAMVHVMLLSHTRRDSDYALQCWDCSRNPVDELQLQVLPGKGEPPLDAPGGFLFVNWEKSTGR